MATEPPQDQPLAAAIATATRSVHSKLNKLIISRLPLALPPRAADPSVYISGLLHIAPIYITFETLWRNFLVVPPPPEADNGSKDGSLLDVPLNTSVTLVPEEEHQKQLPSLDPRIRSVLEDLHLTGLMRADRLRGDIRALTGWTEAELEEQLRAVSQTGRLVEFLKHIKRTIETRPHVLLAFSYILFMALFAGGRFIRASLESVGDQFWQGVPSPVRPTLCPCADNSQPDNGEPAGNMSEEDLAAVGEKHAAPLRFPLRFFHFPTPEDGEDLKREFKKRLADAEAVLTAQEKKDIVREAVCIFDNMNLLVRQLDAVCVDTDQSDADIDPTASMESLASLLKNPLGTRLRDSVVVAKERSAKSSSRMSSDNDGSGSTPRKGLDSHHASNSSTPSRRIHTPSDHPTHHQHHPAMDMADAELCPGFPKSMRFERALAKPARGHGSYDGSAELAGSLKMASKSVRGVHVTNLVVVVAFGAIILGALFTGRAG